MTLDDIRSLVASVDPTASHYETTGGRQYTVWREYRRLSPTADDRHIAGWAFQVDRFTDEEDDEIAEALFTALDSDPRVSMQHIIDYERDTRYIHHIFDCEGM